MSKGSGQGRSFAHIAATATATATATASVACVLPFYTSPEGGIEKEEKNHILFGRLASGKWLVGWLVLQCCEGLFCMVMIYE